MNFIKQTTPPSSPLDTLKGFFHRIIDMQEYVASRVEDDEDLLEFIEAMKVMSYAALGEHVEIKSEMIGRYNQRRIANSGYTYDDGSPVVEHFEGNGLTSTFYPRYGGNRDLALARHYKSAAEMNQRFAEECTARAEGREWPVKEHCERRNGAAASETDTEVG